MHILASIFLNIMPPLPLLHGVGAYTTGITDKFGTIILTHLFCPHFGGKSSTEHHSASGFPPRSDEKIYANPADLILSVIPMILHSHSCDGGHALPSYRDEAAGGVLRSRANGMPRASHGQHPRCSSVSPEQRR